MHSDEENISDAEIYDVLNRTVIRRVRSVRSRPNISNMYGEKDFYQRFRLTKLSAYSVLELIGPHIKNKTSWNNSLSEEEMFLITLRVYATGGMLMSIGDIYKVSPSTVSKVVTIVSHYIALLKDRLIIFPNSSDKLLKAKKDFYGIAKFPKVIAALDCTHVKIISPGGNNAEIYRNRKGFFSINVQTMCDANLKIINIVARWPGSAHDSNILRNSTIYSRLESEEFGDSIVLADSGYPNKPYMMTPLSDVRNLEENLYNESQIRTRCTVERSYGVWKRRFPILSLGIRLNIKKVQSIIVATAILHNICCMNNETETPELPSEVSETIDFVLSVPNNRARDSSNTNALERRVLINQYFKNLLTN